MIISASRRTDIPAFYSDWLFKRIEQGYLYVRNPYNPNQISRVDLSPSVVDCIVFVTKNPMRMLDRLDLLSRYHYYFQFTVTPYDQDLETNVLPADIIVDIFKRLSRSIGKERVIWRYDPIILTDRYDMDFHRESFSRMAKELSPYTERCVISFLDIYKNTAWNLSDINLVDLSVCRMKEAARMISSLAGENSLEVVSCAEEIDLDEYGIPHGKCIDEELISRITGYPLNIKKDRAQRAECCCNSSIDIGAYNTCPHGCLYCYANTSAGTARKALALHDCESPLIIGNVGPNDRITERKASSCIEHQDRFAF